MRVVKPLAFLVVLVSVASLAGCGGDGAAMDYTVSAVTNPNSGEVSDALTRFDTPDAVLAEHLAALNGCDWKRLMAQYPDSYELRLPGSVVSGREEANATFAGFVLPHDQGGLCGITFSEEGRQVTDGVIAVNWVADAEFLSEPYRGSDAYIVDDGLMVSMVSTFDGAELKFADTYTVSAVTNANTGEVSDALTRFDTPDAVLAEHMAALNGCDWKRLMAQYPDSYELRLPGSVVSGREEANATFAGFVLPHDQGGLCGITFTEEGRQVTDGVIAVNWVANAAFLSEPYRGSDAYITDDGLMVSMVSTFDGAELKFNP